MQNFQNGNDTKGKKVTDRNEKEYPSNHGREGSSAYYSGVNISAYSNDEGTKSGDNITPTGDEQICALIRCVCGTREYDHHRKLDALV